MFGKLPFVASISMNKQQNLSFSVKLLSKTSFEVYQNNDLVGLYSFYEDIFLVGATVVLERDNVETLEKYVGKNIYVSYSTVLNETQSIISKLKISPVSKQSNSLSLKYVDENIARSIFIVDEVINEYNKVGIDDNNLIAQKTADFIEERFKIINDELSDVENQIETYRKVNQITDLDVQAGITLDEGAFLKKILLKLKLKLD